MSRKSRYFKRGKLQPSPWAEGPPPATAERVVVPSHLRGKEIGLFFRDRKKKKSQLNLSKKDNETLITLRIPPAVVSKVKRNIDSISVIAKKMDIPMVKPEDLFNGEEISKPRTETTSTSSGLDNDIWWEPNKLNEDNDAIKHEIDSKSKEESPFYLDTIPSTSSEPPPDYIRIDDPHYCDGAKVVSLSRPANKILSLRGGGNYKYGYHDIITGTYEEKLDECLSKGIGICTVNEDIQKLSQLFSDSYNEMIVKSSFKKMMNFRETLPTFKKAPELLEVIEKNQVIVISGETGCGKSTQVPQLILDNAICDMRGGNIKILVTQPRRIAASSLAARVASERAEKLGDSVGYAVRLEKVEARPRGSIMFCTTGILLADLEVNQGLTNYSHIILDEVHERDCQIDLAMCMLKKVLKKRKDLKLILMSATIDAEKLSSFFDDCPMIHIEGLAFPVQDIYLEDILERIDFQLEEPAPSRGGRKWGKHKRGNAGYNMQQDIMYKAEIAFWLESMKPKLSPKVYKTLQDYRIEQMNMELICSLLVNISRGPPGAILVFLPGIGEITKLIREINESGKFPPSLYEIYPLHSKLASLDQHRIFQRPPGNVRKIIIATNIAETSITIDDIVYVVDSGKIKMKGLNVEENVTTLRVEWVAQANLRQRRGRAGRCQPGVCFHLLTSYRASKLEERLLPELQRSDLLEPVLAIKRLRLGRAAHALLTVPSPPDRSTVQWAVKHLQQCGALDDSEKLTPLGWHLARLPVHPSAGKLLLLGALFGCLDRAASVAAVWGFKDPFQLVIGKEIEAAMAKRKLALGEPSDHVAISEAIIRWEQCPKSRRREFSYENFISSNTVDLLSDMKRQLGDSLRQMGFLASGDVKSAWENRNANNLSLFKAVVAASLYPNIACVSWGSLQKKKQRIRVHTADDKKLVSVHPSSMMSTSNRMRGPVTLCDNPGANWLVYWLKQRSSDLFLLEVTLVYTLPLLFFGEVNVVLGNKEKDESFNNDCLLTISSVKVRCPKTTAAMLFQLRSLLDQVLATKICETSDEGTRHSEFEECVLNAVIELITAEDERAEYLEDIDSRSESDASDFGGSSDNLNRKSRYANSSSARNS